MSRHKDNPDFLNIISALSGEYVNHGNASIEKNKSLKHKVSGNVKQMHAKTPYELVKNRFHSHKILGEDAEIKELRNKEQEVEQRILDLVQHMG